MPDGSRKDYNDYRRFSVWAIRESDLFTLEIDELDEMEILFEDIYGSLFQSGQIHLTKLLKQRAKLMEKLDTKKVEAIDAMRDAHCINQIQMYCDREFEG